MVIISQPIIIPHMPLFGISEFRFLRTSKHVKTKADILKNAKLFKIKFCARSSAVTDQSTFKAYSVCSVYLG